MDNKIDARILQMLGHQVLEEHTKKTIGKKFEPCLECIYLGIQKGFDRGLKLPQRTDSEVKHGA